MGSGLRICIKNLDFSLSRRPDSNPGGILTTAEAYRGIDRQVHEILTNDGIVYIL